MFRSYDAVESAIGNVAGNIVNTSIYRCGNCNWYTRITFKSAPQLRDVKPEPSLIGTKTP